MGKEVYSVFTKLDYATHKPLFRYPARYTKIYLFKTAKITFPMDWLNQNLEYIPTISLALN